MRLYLVTKEGLKPVGWSTSAMDQSGNMWCLFCACQWLPMTQAAHTSFPMMPQKPQTQGKHQDEQWQSETDARILDTLVPTDSTSRGGIHHR